MYRISLLIAGIVIGGFAVLGTLAQSTPTPSASVSGVDTIFARALVVGQENQPIGDVTFAEREDGKILITAVLTGLPPGFHGFHLHDHIFCDMKAQLEWGLYHAEFDAGQHPDHAGDFPPLLVAEDGTAFLSFATDRLTIQKILYPAEGSSVVIDSGPDNFANIPARYVSDDAANAPASIADEETLRWGDSGVRIACGSVEPVETDQLN